MRVQNPTHAFKPFALSWRNVRILIQLASLKTVNKNCNIQNVFLGVSAQEVSNAIP